MAAQVLKNSSSERFSKSEMWGLVIAELTEARVVNGRHKDGSVFPVLLTSSAISVGGVQLYALLFEFLPKNAAVVTCDLDGVIQSATTNIGSILEGYTSKRMLGTKVLSYFEAASTLLEDSIEKGVAGKFGKDAKHIIGEEMRVKSIPKSGDSKLIAFQVIDSRDNMYVVTLKLASTLAARSGSVDESSSGSSYEFDAFARGGE
jgi:hypothetical protein